MSRTPPPPPRMVLAPVQEPGSSCSPQPVTTRTHAPASTPASLLPSPGGRLSTLPQPPQQPLQEAPTIPPMARPGVSESRPRKPTPTGQSQPPAAASIGEAGTRTAPVGETATTADNITVHRATPAVTADIAKAAVADGCPPLDRGATLDTGGRPGARRVTAVSDQTGAVAANKAVTGDIRVGVGGEEFGTRVDSRVTTAAVTTDSVIDACRE